MVCKYQFSLGQWILCSLRVPLNVPRQCASVSHIQANFRQTRSSRPVCHLIQLLLKLCLHFFARSISTPTPLKLRSASTASTVSSDDALLPYPLREHHLLSSSRSVRITRSIHRRRIYHLHVFVPRMNARAGIYMSLSYIPLSLGTKRGERFECLYLSCRQREWFYTSSPYAGRPKVSRKRAFGPC